MLEYIVVGEHSKYFYEIAINRNKFRKRKQFLIKHMSIWVNQIVSFPIASG